MKFGQKDWASFVFCQSARKLPKNKEKVLFYETYFEVGEISTGNHLCGPIIR